LKTLLIIVIGLGGGVVVGGALGAFITLIKLIPRLLQLTETGEYVTMYHNIFSISSFLFTFVYFFNIDLGFSVFLASIVGLIMGIFIGLFSSALAEVLNVIPVISKKLQIVEQVRVVIYTLAFAKVFGSLYFWLLY